MRASDASDKSVLYPAWYCARTKPKHEHLAALSVARQLGLGVFHPRLRLERSTVRGVVRVVEPLFPCYLFVRCTSADDADAVRYVSGISSLVQFGQRTAIVPDDVIEELQQCFESGEPMAVEGTLCSGAEVTVVQGSFLGSHGVVVRVLPAKQRVQILLDFLGRATLAEVDRMSLVCDTVSMADLLPALACDAQDQTPSPYASYA